MDALGDLVARSRRSDDPALVAASENRRYDYHRFCTTAWKTGNFWRRIGVHRDAIVAVADDPSPEAVFSFLGAALLGARTRFGLPDARSGEERRIDARVLVAPHDRIDAYGVPPGGKRVAYDGPPEDPNVAHFERDVWSENPSFPETSIDPETVSLATETEDFSHADLLSAVRTVADDWDLATGDEVAVRAPLADPGTVVAGLVAPLLGGATILFPDEEGAVGDFAVAEDDAPEQETVRPAAVV